MLGSTTCNHFFDQEELDASSFRFHRQEAFAKLDEQELATSSYLDHRQELAILVGKKKH